mmetsp:Transcript_73584/g.66219  ORF Transcript_73584/g.66219 Transcript_73584/m.66219 type:complete len:288 (+) Transcript_73584:81-944(+)
MAHLFKRLQMTMANRIRLLPTKSPKKSTKIVLYSSGILFATSFCASSIALNTTIMAYPQIDVASHFHLLESLRELAPVIDAPGMLNQFLSALKAENSVDGLFDCQFVKKLFIESGIADDALIDHLINIVDWNENGKLTKYEVAALFTLFNVGTDVERYQFLFQCLDLDQSGTVKKDEFREILTCLLEAKYHIYGLSNEHDPDEIYIDLGPDDYHTMAKFAANQLVRKIFIYADQKRRGKLNWTEFLHWCYRGGSEVLALKELLYQTHESSTASETVHNYKVGYIPGY